MVELEPILYLRGELREMSNKGGGGSKKDPWIDIDATGLRSALAERLDESARLMSSLPPSIADQVGLPLRVALRKEALAKSNRPTKFLEASGAPVTAAGKAGELFARVRRRELQTLRAAVVGGVKNDDLYAISTIEALSIVEPLRDAFHAEDLDALEEVLYAARSEDRLIRLDLFPWLNVHTRWIDESFGSHLAAIGLEVKGVRGTRRRESVYVEPGQDVDLQEVAALYGVRSASTEPTYGHWRGVGPQSMAIVGPVPRELHQTISQTTSGAIVGVLDSGIGTPLLEPHVQARETYDVGADLNPEHGTFVAGLVLAGKALNDGESCFGDDSAVVVDGQVLPANDIGENELLERIDETIRKHPEVRVWNCSFATRRELDPLEYSVFASEMDKLSSELGILFVQAAGNYESLPVRTWPPSASAALTDGIAAPADAVNSLVVGSLTHRDGACTPVKAPASYSRRGPSFGGQTKPDVTFWSGDFGPNGELPHAGIRSTVPGDQIAESVGTSFATPLVSAIAANVWAELEAAGGPDPDPALVKGVLVHSASVSSHTMVGPHKNYYGAGVPESGLASLFEASDSFTTIHRVDLQSKVSWLRAPFPVPPCLFTADGKLKAEIFMTVIYSPQLDQGCGEEAVRTCVEASFGVISRVDGKVKISGKVPEEKTSGAHPWEAQLLAAGKWSPVRTHYARFPRGVGGDEWGLKLTLTEREDSDDGIDQSAYVLLTLRGIEPGLPVHAQGIAEVQRLALWHTQLSQKTTVTVDASV